MICNLTLSEDVPTNLNMNAFHSVLLNWDHPRFPNVLNGLIQRLQEKLGRDGRAPVPRCFYLFGNDRDDMKHMKHMKLMWYFFRKLAPFRHDFQPVFFISPGLWGNQTDVMQPLTRDGAQFVDLVLAHLMW